MTQNLTIRQTIISDISLTELVKRFRGWPDRLYALKDQLADIDFENATDKTVDNIEDEIKTLEAELGFEIINEVDENGKKIFSNEKMRDGELRRRLSKNQDWIALMNKLRGARRAEAERKQHFAKIRNQLEWAKDSYFTDKAVLETIAGLCYESVAVTKIEKTIARAGEFGNGN